MTAYCEAQGFAQQGDELMPERKTRVEHGHKFAWQEDLGFWCNTDVGSGRSAVLIFPPKGGRLDWYIFVPGTQFSQRLEGKDMEERCFSIAVGCITQGISSVKTS